MSYTFTLNFEPMRNYLHVTVTGENSFKNVAQYLSEIRDFCQKHKCSKVLIVENLTGSSLDTFSIFDLISNASKVTRQDGLKIAYVDANPEHNVNALKFAENVAVNRFVHVRVFSTIHEAEQWLTIEQGSNIKDS